MNIVAPLIAVHRVVRAAFAIVLTCACLTAGAQVNSWINPTSGPWDQATNWSLGVLPNSSQSVMITNSGFKAVAINPSTPINFPGAMTVSTLTIGGATNSHNLLLLNFFGTNLPLTVLNGLTLHDNAEILNLNSSLVVPGGTFTVTNSQINQDGGFIHTMNAPMSLQDSAYNLTNGDFEGGMVTLGFPVSAQFNQFGGKVLITNLVFGENVMGSGGNYALYGGSLNLPGGLTMIDADNSFSSYFQAGGTNLTGNVFLEPGIFGGSPSFTLNGGLLADNNVTLEADNFGGITLTQNGGTHIITNSLSIPGAAASSTEVHPAVYQLNGGTLSAASMSMDATMGTAEFNETNGIAYVGGIQGVSAPFDSFWVPEINLSGGTLASSNIDMNGGGEINQSGGTLIVSNLLSFEKFIDPGGTLFTNFSTYTLQGGTLIASNISVGGIFIIGDSPANRISNPGTLTLSNTIVISNAVEQLGSFILGGNATINLAGSASQLSFANSSGETWAGGATLVILNWDGNLSGGGAEQLKFGSGSTGLTLQQLSQIKFINPAGLAPGSYSAQILSSGEVVPAGVSSNPGLVNSWTNPASGNWDQATNWSLGVLPNSSQSVMITNSGFKAVAINSSTPINFPGSMSVSNLTIISPTNSANTLLMNFVGAGNPLVIGVGSNSPGSLIIGDTTSAMVMFSSGLIVNNALGTSNSHMGAFEINGTFVQSENSEIVAGFLDLNSTGTYNMTNGMLFVGAQFINGTFNQLGGTNTGEISVSNGAYNMDGGLAKGNLLSVGGSFFQGGGLVDMQTVDWTSHNGNTLDLGTLRSGVINVHSNALVFFGEGNNVPGTVEADFLNISNSASVSALAYNIFVTNNLDLSGNARMDIEGTTGPGSALIVGTITMSGNSTIEQGGNTMTEVSSNLDMSGGQYSLGGGQLTVANIVLSNAANLVQSGGTITQSGTLTLANAGLTAGPGSQQFGKLLLSTGGNTKSTLTLSPGASALHFANSSSLIWSNAATLVISNWNGSPSGGGSQQIFFGSDNTGLTSQQLSQVQFVNPAGLPSGIYSARILSSGEVVPNQVIAASVAFSQQGNNLVLSWPSGWTLQSGTNVLGPYSDVTNAASPYTNNVTLQPQQFFRLRQ